MLQVWDWRDQKILARLLKPGLGGGAIWIDKERIVTPPLNMDPSDALNLWDFQSGAIETVPMPAPPLRDRGGGFVASASGTHLTVLRTSHRAIVFDTKTWRPVGDIGGINAAAIAMSPDGAELAVSNYDGTLKVIDINTGKIRLNLKAWADSGMSICWSPDGKMIASGEYGKHQERNQVTGIIETRYDVSAIKIWSAKDGILISESKITIPETGIQYLRFSPDSAFLISNQRDALLRVWRAEDMKLVRTISTDGPADFMSFSPSGQYLAVTRRDSVLIFAWPKL